MPKQKLECIGDPDIELLKEGYQLIGIDEAGRGPIAGPMFVGIVHFKKQRDCCDLGLKDSKRFSSESKRRKIEQKIEKTAWEHSVCVIPVSEIESAINLNDLFDKYVAKCALEMWPLTIPYIPFSTWQSPVWKGSATKIRILVDGNRKINGIPKEIQICRPKLDVTSWHVAAASILAKTAQVKYMEILHKRHPDYGFAKHRGYGTKDHFEAIKKYGFLKEHRQSWIKPEKIA